MQDAPLVIRCSSLPRVMKCPASLCPEPGEPVTDTHDETAAIGTAVHAMAAQYVQTGSCEFDQIVARYGVDADECERLFEYVKQAWETVHGAIARVSIEERRSHVL